MFFAADFFLMPSLKNLCEEWLTKNIKIESTAEILSLGVSFKLSKLVEAAVCFMYDNKEAVIASQGWLQNKVFILDEEENRAMIESVP